jgi:predicted ATPase/class 3 adenylate cyclase/Flp pilus assembly protein TadD
VSGTHALLFTDIVDSTRLNETLGDDVMAPIWRSHDAAARELMRLWHGQEVARSDGFLVLFESAAAAVQFAVAYHAALRTIDSRLLARVGVHVGPVSLRENSEVDQSRGAPKFEVDGVALPLAARVMSAAHGRQTLLSDQAFQSLGTTALRTKSHGHWRLKGIAQPIELFEVGEDDDAFVPPDDSVKAYRVVRTGDEWTPLRSIPNNLPAERDPFVGREDALQALQKVLDGPTRLTTLLGIGGIGKTRLALRHARTWLGDYPGGAWFCDLSTSRGVDGIVNAVAQALDIPLGKLDPVQQIGAAISARGPCLVILDTFEQVARHAEATLGLWMSHAAEAKFLVTSREILGISGEHTLVVAPLQPDEGAQLFLRRAAAANDRFAPNGHDVAAIPLLVKLLDGLPLAIELAAARTRVLSPKMLLDRMNERFSILSARGGRLDRQVTLRATLDWSWDLLSAHEKAALAQLSTFEGGFTLQAVEAVLHSAPDAYAPLAVDCLQSLIDKSFVRQVGEGRFDLLQSVQAYAAQHLHAEGRFEGSGPLAELAVESRHGAYFAGLSPDEVIGSRGMELDNLSAACRRAVARGDAQVATRTLELAWAVLELRGPFKFGVDLSTLVLSMPRMSAASHARLVLGSALQALGSIEPAREAFEGALQSSRATGDHQSVADALSKLGNLCANAGHMEEARSHLTAALGLARDIADVGRECEALSALGTLYEYLGRFDAALADYEEALVLARKSNNRRWEGGILGNLGRVYHSRGDALAARESFRAGLELARELGDRKWEGNALCNLGLLEHIRGNASEARATLEASLQLAREIGHARLEAFVACNLGIVEDAAGKSTRAKAHLIAALGMAERLEDRRLEGQVLGYLGLTCVRLQETEEGQRLLERGRATLHSLNDELSLAMLLCNSAEARMLLGQPELARADCVAARRLAEGLVDVAAPELTQALNRVSALIDAGCIDTTVVAQ